MNLDLMIKVIPIAGAIGLLFALVKAISINKMDPGNDRIREIGGHIRDGAMAFLAREYKILAIFVVVVAVLLGFANHSWLKLVAL